MRKKEKDPEFETFVLEIPSAKDPFNFDADLDPDLYPGSAFEKKDPNPNLDHKHLFKIF